MARSIGFDVRKRRRWWSGKVKDGQALGHVFLQPFGQLRGCVAVSFHQVRQSGLRLGQVGSIPDSAQLGADAFADGGIRRVMDGVLRQVELAALPFGAAQHGPARGAQTGVVIGYDIFHPTQTARLQALQKGSPVDLSLRQGHRDAQHPAPGVRADTDGRKHGGITNHAADAHLLVAGIEEEIADLPEGAISPGLQLLVQQPGGTADLA